MKFEVMEITPAVAEMMLKHNGKNRNISRHYVLALSEDMKSGNWELTPSPIIFDKDGNLLDGQHRLASVIKSGVTCKFVVCTEAETTYMIDNNRRRTVLNQLTMKGSALPIEILNNQMIAVATLALTIGGSSSNRNKTTHQIEEFIFENQDYFTELSRITKKNHSRGISISPVYYALFSGMRNGIPVEKVENFYTLLLRGYSNGSDLDNMVIRHRNYLILNSGRSSAVNKDEFIKRTQSCLERYAKGTAVQKNYAPSQFVFAM